MAADCGRDHDRSNAGGRRAATTRSAPAVESERRELISRIQAGEAEQDRLRARIDSLSVEITGFVPLPWAPTPRPRTSPTRLPAWSWRSGAPRPGPGVMITVDDAPSANRDARDRVLDTDLQMLANGLWKAGAEAIDINGHRLSNLTAIRSAGDAITVDYRSLTRPYEVHAIGDPRTLEARFVESSKGAHGGTNWHRTVECGTRSRGGPAWSCRRILAWSSSRAAIHAMTIRAGPLPTGKGAMIPLLGLIAGIVLGLVLEPTIPSGAAAYLPIAIVAAMDALFGAFRAYSRAPSPTGCSWCRSCPTC